MVAQLVFFIALVLFLILLVRRFSKTPEVLKSIGASSANFGRSIARAVGRVGSGVADRTREARQRIPLLSDRKTEINTLGNGRGFWQEKAGDQPEVPGFFDEGDELYKKGEYDKAEELFLKAATRTPGDARVYARLGVIYLHNKNYSDAIEALKVAAKYDQYNPSRHYNLALAYHGNNDRQKAISSTREAIALDPVTKKYRVLLEQLLERK